MKKIGLGDTGMAKNLLKGGFAVRGFDLREERMTYFPMDSLHPFDKFHHIL